MRIRQTVSCFPARSRMLSPEPLPDRWRTRTIWLHPPDFPVSVYPCERKE